MYNPLENEESAFRFVLGTLAYFAPIVLASWIATWLGVVVFVIATVVAVVVLRRDRPSQPADSRVGRAEVEDTWRIMVLADETLESPRLQEVIVRLADGVAEDVLLVCPALPSPSNAGGADEPRVPAAVEARLQAAVASLRASGVAARGELGAADPLVALDAALERFPADEVVVSTHAVESSPLIAEDVVGAVSRRFDGPVTHVVSDIPAAP
jgi:hypothetical protein